MPIFDLNDTNLLRQIIMDYYSSPRNTLIMFNI